VRLTDEAAPGEQRGSGNRADDRDRSQRTTSRRRSASSRLPLTRSFFVR
jgi:hypothetical protein